MSGLTLAACAPMCDAIEAANKQDEKGSAGGLTGGVTGFAGGIYRGTVGGTILMGESVALIKVGC